MSRMVCEHGKQAGSVPNWQGGWNGPSSRCSCCLSIFGYIDSFSAGSDSGHSRSWQPKDKCEQCGGKYVEHSWGSSLNGSGGT